MAMMRVQDRALFTATELALIEASQPSRIKAYTPVQLNDRIARARRFWDKYRELARQQQRGTKKSPQLGRPQPFSNARTQRKAQVFAGALKRFEKRLEQLTREKGRKSRAAKPVPKISRRQAAQGETIRRKKQQSQAANEAALAPRVARQVQKTATRAIQGHVRASGTRRQAKRDAK
jgi:hypothetical protein